jgi:hypothetical protein
VQAVSRPLLYKRVEIGDVSQLEIFVETVLELELAGTHVGGCVRTLHVDDLELRPLPGDSAMAHADLLDHLTTTLLYLDRLEDLKLPMGATVACLALVSRHCRQTLRALVVPAVGSPTHRVLEFVGHLENLVTLYIRPQASYQCLPAEGWTLPRLREFRWEGGQDDGDDYRDSIYLQKCHFISLRVLSVYLPYLSTDDAELLVDFLQRHSFVHDLRLALQSAELAALLLPLTHCSTFVAFDSPPTDLAF